VNVLIAVLGCERDRELYEVLRQTCYTGCDLHRFFQGTIAQWHDEVQVPVDDDYISLPMKTNAICKWALRNGFDAIFKCDTDTYVDVGRLLNSGFEQHRYIGFCRGEGQIGYGSGGSGYWLVGQDTIKLIADAELTPDVMVPGRGSIRGEDLQVGKVLQNAGILCVKDERYRLNLPGPEPKNDVITLHDVCNADKKAALLAAHARNQC